MDVKYGILRFKGINDLLVKCAKITAMQAESSKSMMDYFKEREIPFTPVGDNMAIDIKHLSKEDIRNLRDHNQIRNEIFENQIKEWNEQA